MIDRQYKEMNRMSRIGILKLVSVILTLLLITKLFYLQVVRFDYYRDKAEGQHKSYVTIAARRGSIFAANGALEDAVLATDVVLDLLYVDPALIEEEDQTLIAETLAPLLYAKDQEEKEKEEQLNQGREQEYEDILLNTEEVFLNAAGELVEVVPLKLSEEEAAASYENQIDKYKKDIISKMSKKEVDYVPLLKDFTPELGKEIADLHLRGVFVLNEEVYADPVLISDPASTAHALYNLVNISEPELKIKLERRAIHYYPIKGKLDPNFSEQLLKELERKFIEQSKDYPFKIPAETVDQLKRRMVLKGVGIKPEYHRYYPEHTLLSSVIGFVNKERLGDRQGIGQYGLEGQFDEASNGISLKGNDGQLLFDRDARGRQIAVGDRLVEEKEDGDDIYLTVNRAIQKKVEELLAEKVKEFGAEGGEVIVMEVDTGAILAMANFPSFDPNQYEKAYEKYEGGVNAGEYKNKIGPLVYQNPSITAVYEPGSVFKVITLASTLDAGEITPDTVNCEMQASIYRDGYEIQNHDGRANGCIDMTRLLELSSNLSAAFVAEKLGRDMFYQYMQNFGMGHLTGIEIPNLETTGWVKAPGKWADVDLATAGFGQGFAVTPLQMVRMVGALANEGQLMRPYLIRKAVDPNTGEEKVTEKKVQRQVISFKAAEQIKAMMISSVEHGFANKGAVQGYFVGGKTGTAQIAKAEGGGYEEGLLGHVYATFAGFAPGDEPRFAALVKIDRPSLKSPWGESSAAPLFSEIMEYILQYYGVEKER